MTLIRSLVLLLLVTLSVAGEELRLSAMRLRLDFPGRNQPRENRWFATVDPKYSHGDTNRAATARDVMLVKDGKGKTMAIAVSNSRTNGNLFSTNDLARFENLGADYRILSKGFTNFLGVRAYRFTAQNTNAEVQGKALVHAFYAHDLEYRIFAATFYDVAPESDPEILSILHSLQFSK